MVENEIGVNVNGITSIFAITFRARLYDMLIVKMTISTKVSMTFLMTMMIISPVFGDNWAVLIAGSRYFFNYRHQSDICHAYQILTKKGGIPPSNIVGMLSFVSHQMLFFFDRCLQ